MKLHLRFTNGDFPGDQLAARLKVIQQFTEELRKKCSEAKVDIYVGEQTRPVLQVMEAGMTYDGEAWTEFFMQPR